MKKLVIAAMFLSVIPTTASADVYVKVDANGNAIGGAIMCDAATCGAGSQYSQLTLQEGERYVLQGVGVDYGIGNNNSNTEVRHDGGSNEWVVTRTQSAGNAPTVERFEVITPSPVPVVQPVETTTVVDSATATIDTATATIDSSTAIIVELRAQIEMLYAIIRAMFVRLGWSL